MPRLLVPPFTFKGRSVTVNRQLKARQMKNPYKDFPSNLTELHSEELGLRKQALEILNAEQRLILHLNAIERAMSVAKIVVGYSQEDEDFKVIKMLSIRIFNAFGASLMLAFSGYHQKSAMVLRDTLETVFLLGLFKRDRGAIERWRYADRKTMKREFSPAAVRKFLDDTDGLSSRKREETYKMFCELAAHPNMHSQHMLRPEKGGDIVMGPFMEATTIEAGISEMGKLAVQAGEVMSALLPPAWDQDGVRSSFNQIKVYWIKEFYPHVYNNFATKI